MAIQCMATVTVIRRTVIRRTVTRLLTMGTRRDVTMHAATTATKPSEHDPPVLSAGGITRGLPRQRDALIKLALVDRFMP